jgi:hypothetical protein
MTILKIGRRIAFCTPFLASAALMLPAVAPAARTPVVKPPSASTGGALEVSGSSATLEGTVNPHGTESSCYFQYGTTVAYGEQTPTASVGAGTVPAKVSQAISGLQLGTTYHYRIVSVTSSGTIIAGADRVFTTKRIPLRLKIGKLLEPVVYGGRFTIEGALSGTGSGNDQVVLQSSPFPYLESFADISDPILANATGGFSFSLASPTQNTELRVSTLDVPPISSPPITVRVAVRVTLHARPTGRRGYVRLYGTVTPAIEGAPVSFQLMRPGLGPATAAGTVLKRGTAKVSRFSSLVYVRHGRGGAYRALVRVTNGKLVSGYSPTVLVHSAPMRARKAR